MSLSSSSLHGTVSFEGMTSTSDFASSTKGMAGITGITGITGVTDMAGLTLPTVLAVPAAPTVAPLKELTGDTLAALVAEPETKPKPEAKVDVRSRVRPANRAPHRTAHRSNVLMPQRELAGRNDTSNILIIWVTCSVIVGALIIPSAVLLLPRLRGKPSEPEGGLQQETELTTQYPLPGGSCLHRPKVSDNIDGLFEANISRKSVPVQTQEPVCCLYNASRFRKEFRHDYLPKHVPFQLCACLVYWSVGVAHGKLMSRSPKFDEKYGLRQMGSLKGSAKVLLTMGGYPSDDTHFTRLGFVPGLMNLLAANVLDWLTDYQLDGVNIHWRTLAGECGDRNDFAILLNLIDILDDMFKMNGRQYEIAMILPYPAGVDLAQLLPRLKFAFFETHLTNFSHNAITGCRANLETTRGLFRETAPMSSVGTHVCYSMSALLWAVQVEGQQNGMFFSQKSFLPASRVSRQAGRVALFEICGISTEYEAYNYQSCLLLVKKGTNINSDGISAYVTDDDDALKEKKQLDMCTLVYDIDYDLYKRPCTFGLDWALKRILLVP